MVDMRQTAFILNQLHTDGTRMDRMEEPVPLVLQPSFHMTAS